MGPLHTGDMGWSVTDLWHNVSFDLGWLVIYNNNKDNYYYYHPYIIIITENNNNVLGGIPPS